MPQKFYPLEKNGPKELSVDTGFTIFSKVKIGYQSKLLKEFTYSELSKVQEVMIPSTPDQKITLQFKRALYLFPEMEILKNGEPLEGSNTHPAEIIRQIFILICVIAGFNFIGSLMVFGGSDLTEASLSGVAIASVLLITPIIFLVLGFWFKKSLSKIALGIIIGLLSIDMLLTISSLGVASQEMVTYPLFGFLFRIVIIIYLTRGFAAADSLNQSKKGYFPI